MPINSKIQAIYNDERHAGDIDLTCDVASWDGIHSFDWEAKIPNTTVDVLMGVEVGLCRRAGGARQLLIRFVDTRVEFERPGGGGYWSQWKAQPAVWAIAFGAAEIREIEQHVKTVDDTLIHREPWIDTKSRIAQARWMTSDNHITGIAVALRASQELVPTVHCISFLTKGHYFRKLQVDDQSPKLIDELSKAYLKAVKSNPLPSGVTKEGPEHTLELAKPKTAFRTDYISEGDSILELEIEGVGGYTTMNQSYAQPTSVVQHLVSDKITIRNPTPKKHYIKHISTFVKVGDAEFVECPKDLTYLGLSYDYTMMWGKKQANPTWEEETSFNVAANSQQDFFVKGILRIHDATANSSHPFNRRLHKSLDEPVTVKAVFTDDQGHTKSICWDTVNDPLPERLNSYDAVCANASEVKRLGTDRGFGPDNECILWLHMDDPETLQRTYIIVTHAKSNPSCWYVRAETTTGDVPTNYTKVSPLQFHRIVYDAEEPELDMTKKWGRSYKNCVLTLLLDLEQKIVYGLKASISIGVSKIEQSIYLDQTVVEAES